MTLRRSIFVGLLAATAALAADAQPQLWLRVEHNIRLEPRLRVYDWVQFRVDDRTVELRGFVSLPSLRGTIEKLVRQVDGVDSVNNELETMPLERDDMAMRVNAFWRIYGNAELRRYHRAKSGGSTIDRGPDGFRTVLIRAIHIIIRNGHLALEGEVLQDRDRKVAEDSAKLVMGVRSIADHLVVARGNTAERQALDADAGRWWSQVSDASTPSLRVDNPSGRVRVQVAATDKLRYRSSSEDRAVEDGDVLFNRFQRKMRLIARPQDGARIDLDIDLPYGYRLDVETVDGPVELSGLLRQAKVRTGSGSVRLEAPWRTIRLSVSALARPPVLDIVKGLLVEDRVIADHPSGARWTLHDVRPDDGEIYGSVEVTANRLGSLTVHNSEIAVDSPVRMHWEAPRVIVDMFRPEQARSLLNRLPRIQPVKREAFEPEAAHFSSDVRLVDLTASVVDSLNRPVTGLGANDFEVIENGVPQRVRIVDGSEAPFNLVLLLDCSTSTLSERFTLVQAAKQFVAVARPQDRVAVYVLSGSYLQVLSPLSNDRAELMRKIEDIPPLSGSTPLYDAIALSYAQELAGLRWERNALIVISDGMDNQILPPVGRIMPSKIPFKDLKRAAAEMNAVIYPIYLDALDSPRVDREQRRRGWKGKARVQLEELAAAAGGRVFRAPSIRALKDVYAQVAQELRSVYRIDYYPLNQSFDGEWRNVEVKTRARGAFVRTRPGYYAW